MASAQQLAAATGNMQQNAQAALPVIPNNGNPAGAYNMPAQNGTAPAIQQGPDLSWLQPSQHMQNVQATLQQLTQRLGGQASQSAPIIPPAQQAAGQRPPPVMPAQVQPTMPQPVMPIMR